MKPASWKARTVSGKPLITKKQFEKLLANVPPAASGWTGPGRDPVPVVKIFLPHIRWMLAWIYPDDHDLAYGITKLHNKPPVLGEIRLSDLVRARIGFGDVSLPPERDMYIKLDKPLSHYLEHGS